MDKWVLMMMKNLIVNLMVLTATYAHLRGGDSLKMIGGGRNISCGVNHTVECPSGTLDCYDESPVYCPNKVGGGKNITCHNNHSFVIYNVECPSGTQDCYDESPVYCKKMVGVEKNITCGGNKTVGCPSGTRDCYDNSTVYCK